MIRRPPRSTRTDTLFPYTTLFRSADRLAVSFPIPHSHFLLPHHTQPVVARLPSTPIGALPCEPSWLPAPSPSHSPRALSPRPRRRPAPRPPRPHRRRKPKQTRWRRPSPATGAKTDRAHV